MNQRFNRILAAVLAASAFTLTSCGDEATFSNLEKNTLTQEIYVVPETITGPVHIFFSPKKEIYLNVNDSKKIQAVFRLNGEILDADEAVNYYHSLLWKIENKKINIPTFRHTFQNPGEYNCILQTVDKFGDTLTDTTIIYVNSPSSITLTSPRDGYNQIDPFSEEEINLKWDAIGIDPWETAECTVYGSNKKDMLWNKPLGTSDCNEKTTIVGPIVPSRDTLESYGIYLEEESITFYWGVIMTISNSNGDQTVDTSNIFQFSTRLIDTDSSILNIPIEYKSFSEIAPPDTRITIKDASGNTLKELYGQNHSFTSTKLAPQTGVTIYLEELYYDEYKTDSLKVDIPEHTVVNLDTVYFEDNIAPTVWPTNMEFPIYAPIEFAVMDKGSGINASLISLHYDETDPVNFSYQEPVLFVMVPNNKQRRLYIQISDYAGNTTIPVFWNVTPKKDKFVLDGPYFYEKELE
ncbi:hypothetical protein [uncultured Fibrobacter sp.]|uniref:hypothetical protein n=1 Tax=uncultured Fibrobacter sp. TaxID=261512 RepID=UPI0025E780BF|nr:hypothetical protein [uncultured Fibrobacter sp.]